MSFYFNLKEGLRADKLKEEGNTHFKAGRYEDALSSYMEVKSLFCFIFP